MGHVNNGDCAKCDSIFNRYPEFNVELRRWFKEFQQKHPEAHISCAGRGKADQDALHNSGRTKALFGQSAHNYNAAIDIFCVLEHSDSIYDLHWFRSILAPEVPEWLNWYGKKDAVFYELPHIELTEWNDLAHKHILKLVEPK